MKIIATIQARSGSGRLPQKVMRPILGKPMLARQIERILRASSVAQVVVATSDRPEDDVIERTAAAYGAGCFRGSEQDVLSRIAGALKAFSADVNVEFCGDSPLPDPGIIDEVVNYFLTSSDMPDMVSTGLKTTYPPGTEVTVYRAAALLETEADVDPNDPLREHVSIHLKRRADRYRIISLEAPDEFRQPDLYLEVDEPDDFEFISWIYEQLYPRNAAFTLDDVLRLIRAHPGCDQKNRNVHRRWKEFRTA